MKSIIAFVLLSLFLMSCSQPQQESTTKEPAESLKEVCVTVDDLPVVGYSINTKEHLLDITTKLIGHFNTFNIPAIGYVNEDKLYQDNKLDSSRVKLLAMWLENGYELGNHTFAHLSYHDVSFEEFTDGIIKGEKITKELAKQHDQELKYFRHPYLKIGNSKSHYDSLIQFLKEHDYIDAPVTIDNEDYLFAFAYHKAYVKGNQADMNKIGNDYVSYMEEKLTFFERNSIKLFGRNIKQTLLIHANLINAHYLDDLALMYQKNGYKFISQTEVLKDTAYRSEITKFGNWGISWIDRWALSQGKKGDFFKGDPVTPTYIANYN